MSVLDRELSNKEKERLAENRRKIFVYMSIDVNGKILFVELLSNWLLEEVIKAKHMSNILRQVKNIPMNDMRPFPENGYIRYTIVRR